MIRLSLVLLLSCFAVGLNSVSCAQDVQQQFEQAYGDGVHHFFSNQYPQAYAAFTRAIETGYSDPRPLYLRGIVAELTARDGKEDFRKAALIEFKSGGSSRLVNAALERIQGPHRGRLEMVRREVRIHTGSDPHAGLIIIDLGAKNAAGDADSQKAGDSEKPMVVPGQERTGSAKID